MEEQDTSRNKRYSRPNIDLPKRRKTIADLILSPISKKARYKVRITKRSRVQTSHAHSRSFRQQNVNEYVMRPDGFDSYVRLDDFFDGEVTKGKPSVEITPRIRQVKGLSVTVSEGFIDEKKWWRKIFKKHADDIVTPYSERRSMRPSWVAKTQVHMALRQRKPVNDPEYIFSQDDVLSFVGNIADNSNRVAFGMGLTRRLFGFHPTQQKHFNRPFFTVYTTMLQLMIFIGIIATHGLAPIGLAFKQTTSAILMPDLSTRLMAHYELQNFWIGPRQEDMIRLGAKFSPCIKRDAWYMDMKSKYNSKVDKSGCCIFSDGSGCIQSARKHCSATLAKWHKGKVCGQDPDYCFDNVNWEKLELHKWPMCKNSTSISKNISSIPENVHMQCNLVGRPCCVGLLGECVMTTREYCQFKKGVFHQEKFLCSQVDCLQEVCGMLPFAIKGSPNQSYRFVTSLYVIPGVLALVITMLFQWIIMFDLERLTGTLEMTTIYLLCGVGGSMFSAIFMPYYVEAGPSGSQFGVLAVLSLEVIRWNVHEKPKIQILTLVVCLGLLFFVGLIVPQVDNWAHVSGFVIGIMMSLAFRPIRHIASRDISLFAIKIQRAFGIIATFTTLIVLAVVYYSSEKPFNCPDCVYFNCLPIKEDFCEGMSVDIFYNSILLSYEEW